MDTENMTPAKKPRLKVRGALIFCGTLLIVALCVTVLFYLARTPLNSWLTRYEEAQPKYVSEAVYDMLFADPDWGLLFDMAGVESTEFEGKAAYISYMEAKVDSTELTCRETAAGLTGDHRYILYCGDEKVAAFTLTDAGDGDFASWTLDSVEVFFTRSESITVVMAPEYTAYVNGVALDDSYLTVSVDTLAEDYIPEGLHGYRWIQLELDGLLVEPEIVILDENNGTVPLHYSSETDIYSIDIPNTVSITDEEYNIVVAAAKAEAQFAIRKINISTLRQYFDSSAQPYADLTDTDPFVKSFKSYEIKEDSITVTDYYRYSDDLFCARVALTMDVTDKSGTVSTYTLDTTYLFTRSNTGAYFVTGHTAEDLQATRTQVRLNYMQGDAVLGTEMVSTVSTVLTPPEVTDALGWGRLNADGTLTMVLTRLEDGTFGIVGGQTLDPMCLYPMFAE